MKILTLVRDCKNCNGHTEWIIKHTKEDLINRMIGRNYIRSNCSICETTDGSLDVLEISILTLKFIKEML